MNSSPLELPFDSDAAQCLVDIRMFAKSTSDDEWTYPIPLPNASAKRQQEFAAGRYCASRALEMLGQNAIVAVQDDRSPLWPAGFTGSISHTDYLAWAVVAKRSSAMGIGIDIEQLATITTVDETLSQVATIEEMSLLEEAGLDRCVAFTLLFSAKEAIYKCLYPLGATELGFLNLTVDSVSVLGIDGVSGVLSLAIGDASWEPVSVRFTLKHDHIFSFCFLPVHAEHSSLAHREVSI